mgnify:CR=1 FL=1
MLDKITLRGLNFPMKRDELVCSSTNKKLIIRTVILSPAHTDGVIELVVVNGLESREYNRLDVAVEEYNKLPN